MSTGAAMTAPHDECVAAACDLARVPDGRLHVVPVVARARHVDPNDRERMPVDDIVGAVEAIRQNVS